MENTRRKKGVQSNRVPPHFDIIPLVAQNRLEVHPSDECKQCTNKAESVGIVDLARRVVRSAFRMSGGSQTLKKTSRKPHGRIGAWIINAARQPIVSPSQPPSSAPPAAPKPWGRFVTVANCQMLYVITQNKKIGASTNSPGRVPDF
jgi:hypothetical protein